MRLGFDGLHELVRPRLSADPLSGHLFIFRNRTADRLKVLYWGGHGLCLWCQRLERGRYHFPDKATDAGDLLRSIRAVEALEAIRSPAARELLKSLDGGCTGGPAHTERDSGTEAAGGEPQMR